MIDDELKAIMDALRHENAAAHNKTRQEFAETADRIAAENRRFFAEKRRPYCRR